MRVDLCKLLLGFNKRRVRCRTDEKSVRSFRVARNWARTRWNRRLIRYYLDTFRLEESAGGFAQEYTAPSSALQPSAVFSVIYNQSSAWFFNGKSCPSFFFCFDSFYRARCEKNLVTSSLVFLRRKKNAIKNRSCIEIFKMASRIIFNIIRIIFKYGRWYYYAESRRDWFVVIQ